MEYSTRKAVNPCGSNVQVGQPALMERFQTQTNSQITTIIRVHLVATAVCHGIAGLFEPLILLVNIQTFFAESLELVQSSTMFLFNLRNRRTLQLQHTGKDLPKEAVECNPPLQLRTHFPSLPLQRHHPDVPTLLKRRLSSNTSATPEAWRISGGGGGGEGGGG